MPFLLLAGLGNPGFRYESTRHNIGFRFLDTIQANCGFPPFSYEKKFLGHISRLDMAGKRVLLLKPDTYMNLSGQSLRALADYFGIPVEETVVAHDDLDIPFGTTKIKSGGGAAGHRGMESVIQSLGTPVFTRIRFGIGRPPGGLSGKDFVLLPFSVAEQEAIAKLWMPQWPELFKILAEQGFTAAANRFGNRSCLPEPVSATGSAGASPAPKTPVDGEQK
jgi:PTH1 family peptidyl-tRNA hydrolase